jgi:CHAT domain-containing protein/tetratricopeptide (TPR) repeat protein
VEVQGLVEEIYQHTVDEIPQWLQARQAELDPKTTTCLVEALKDKAVEYLRADGKKARFAGEAILAVAEWSQEPKHRAVGLRVQAQVLLIAYGELPRALEIYAEAIALVESLQDEVGRAEIAITHIWALALKGEYTAAVQEGEWAIEVLKAAGFSWQQATVQNNLAHIHDRFGYPQRALPLVEASFQVYSALGEQGEAFLTNNLTNQALILCDLGRFQEAIQANEQSLVYAERFRQTSRRAGVQLNLGLAYYMVGYYNQALQLLEQARQAFMVEERPNEFALADTALTYCMLHLRLFEGVIERCVQNRWIFAERGMFQEVGETYYNQARALRGLGRFAEAFKALEEAQNQFKTVKSPVFLARAELEKAALFFEQQQYGPSKEAALAGASQFSQMNMPRAQSQAYLMAARAALETDGLERAEQYAGMAEEQACLHALLPLQGECSQVRGEFALRRGNWQTARLHFNLAIDVLERLQGYIMTEHRADFLDDARKRQLYEDAVSVCLDLDDPLQGMQISERARSGALRDLLAHRIDLRIRARQAADQTLVEALNALQAERNTLLRRQERLAISRAQIDGSEDSQRLMKVEKELEQTWQQLMVRNVDYAHQDFTGSSIQLSQVLGYLDRDTLLISYFTFGRDYLVFTANTSSGNIQVQVSQLKQAVSQADRLGRALQINFDLAACARPEQVEILENQARGLLGKLHDTLLAPLGSEIRKFSKLILVPHGRLHYLPLHALHDGQNYLIESHQVSYLPGASFLTSTPAQDGSDRLVALCMGCSSDERLAFVSQEARRVADLWGGQAFVDSEATLERAQSMIPSANILHISAHGEFRADNPLFSGIQLANGWLTTLDIFNLELNASLVVLSACSTGRSRVGGGDELQGLMRAFLAGGVESLVLSQWAVNDRSTLDLMTAFHRSLLAGSRRGEALRQAQLVLLGGEALYRHPYYWAPFFLVGKA